MKVPESGCCVKLIQLITVFSSTRNCPKSDFTLKPDW